MGSSDHAGGKTKNTPCIAQQTLVALHPCMADPLLSTRARFGKITDDAHHFVMATITAKPIPRNDRMSGASHKGGCEVDASWSLVREQG